MVNFSFDVYDLIKNERVSANDIKIITEWVKSQENNLPNFNSQQIAIFLIACDNDTELVKQCLFGYVKIRSTTPEVFENRNTMNEELISQLETLKFCLIPKRTDKNYAIVIKKVYDPTPSKYHMDVAMKYLFMIYDSLLYKNPPDGVVVLFDMANTSVRHVTRTKVSLLKTLCTYIQHFMPLKIKEIHIMNSMWFLPKFMNILKPFLHKDLLNKIHIHLKDDLEEFYINSIPKSHLPEDYGGFLTTVEKLHEETFKNLTLLNEHFAEDELERLESKNKIFC